MKNMSKNVKILIGVIILAIIVALIISKNSKPKTVVDQPVIEKPAEVLPTLNTKEVLDKKPVKNSNEAEEKLSYAEALVKYSNYRFQFNSSCQSIPTSQSVKVGIDVMLDNRSSKPVTITIGSNSYNLAAYGFKIATLSQTGTFMVDCNTQQNVLTLSVQK